MAPEPSGLKRTRNKHYNAFCMVSWSKRVRWPTKEWWIGCDGPKRFCDLKW